MNDTPTAIATPAPMRSHMDELAVSGAVADEPLPIAKDGPRPRLVPFVPQPAPPPKDVSDEDHVRMAKVTDGDEVDHHRVARLLLQQRNFLVPIPTACAPYNRCQKTGGYLHAASIAAPVQDPRRDAKVVLKAYPSPQHFWTGPVVADEDGMRPPAGIESVYGVSPGGASFPLNCQPLAMTGPNGGSMLASAPPCAHCGMSGTSIQAALRSFVKTGYYGDGMGAEEAFDKSAETMADMWDGANAALLVEHHGVSPADAQKGVWTDCPACAERMPYATCRQAVKGFKADCEAIYAFWRRYHLIQNKIKEERVPAAQREEFERGLRAQWKANVWDLGIQAKKYAPDRFPECAAELVGVSAVVSGTARTRAGETMHVLTTTEPHLLCMETGTYETRANGERRRVFEHHVVAADTTIACPRKSLVTRMMDATIQGGRRPVMRIGDRVRVAFHKRMEFPRPDGSVSVVWEGADACDTTWVAHLAVPHDKATFDEWMARLHADFALGPAPTIEKRVLRIICKEAPGVAEMRMAETMDRLYECTDEACARRGHANCVPTYVREVMRLLHAEGAPAMDNLPVALQGVAVEGSGMRDGEDPLVAARRTVDGLLPMPMDALLLAQRKSDQGRAELQEGLGWHTGKTVEIVTDPGVQAELDIDGAVCRALTLEADASLTAPTKRKVVDALAKLDAVLHGAFGHSNAFQDFRAPKEVGAVVARLLSDFGGGGGGGGNAKRADARGGGGKGDRNRGGRGCKDAWRTNAPRGCRAADDAAWLNKRSAAAGAWSQRQPRRGADVSFAGMCKKIHPGGYQRPEHGVRQLMDEA